MTTIHKRVSLADNTLSVSSIYTLPGSDLNSCCLGYSQQKDKADISAYRVSGPNKSQEIIQLGPTK